MSYGFNHNLKDKKISLYVNDKEVFCASGSGDLYINKNLTVYETASLVYGLIDTLDVYRDLSVYKTSYLNEVFAKKSINISGNLSVKNVASVNSLIVDQQASISDLTIKKDVKIFGNSNVDGDLRVLGSAHIQKDLFISASVDISKDVKINQNLFVLNGNIGIGTSTPQYKLDIKNTNGSSAHIFSSVGPALIIEGTDISSSALRIINSGESPALEIIGLNGAAGLLLKTDGSSPALMVKNKSIFEDLMSVTDLIASGNIIVNRSLITSEMMVKNSLNVKSSVLVSGNIGIGKSNPVSKLDISGSKYDLSNTEGDLRIGNDLYRLKMGVATSGINSGSAAIAVVGGNNKLVFGTGENLSTMVLNSGNVGIGKIPTKEKLEVNGKILSDGILFNSPKNSILNHYEEGTWIPSVNSYVTDPTYNSRSGSFIRIGNMVFFWYNIDLASSTDGTGETLTITGLPYVPNNSNGSANIDLTSGFNEISHQIAGIVEKQTGKIKYFNRFTDSSNISIHDTNLSFNIHGSGMYIIS